MRNLFPILAIGSLALFAFSCKSTKSTASATTEASTAAATIQSEPQMLASIERTACYGRCPMYKATFMDNGEVIYVGKRFVEKIGTYRTLLSAEEVQQIEKNIVAYNYFGLDSLYPTPISDFPSVITEAYLNGKRKKVVDMRNPPENLSDFEKFLDGLLAGKELEKLSDETNYNIKAK